MKKITAVWLTLLVTVPALISFAAPTQYGVYELRIEPTFDVQDKEASKGIPLHGTFGMYLLPNLQVGGGLTFDKKNYDSYWAVSDVWGLNVYGEANVDWNFPVVPYLGCSLGLMDGGGSSDTVFVGTVAPGAKVFLMETLSLSLQLNWNFASDKIYGFNRAGVEGGTVSDEDSGDQSDISLGFAVRLLFY